MTPKQAILEDVNVKDGPSLSETAISVESEHPLSSFTITLYTPDVMLVNELVVLGSPVAVDTSNQL